MKKKQFWIIFWIIFLTVVFAIGSLMYTSVQIRIRQRQQLEEIKRRPLVDLPDDYPQITPNDNLKGYYTVDGVLHIEFNNSPKQNIDYQLDLNQNRINIFDKNGKSLGTTSYDSIPYWIEQDNL